MCRVLCCVYVHSLLIKEPPLGLLSVPSQECAEFKQQPHSAPSLPPLSSQQLGAIFLLLCVSVMGKGPDHHRRGTGKQLRWVAKHLRRSGQIANIGSERAKRGLIKEGETKFQHTSSVAASVQGMSALPSLRLEYLWQQDFSFRCKMKEGWVKA